ncbi:MAG: UDP-3-O-(3-hydroxymyristoyl)glucosamine N-acyltransferase [Opitutales bacterium]|nr:UDP-3-O-(3-hydroxymyristoyl)glucosamine N-acyltransferase [Opitutales bacterium]NRA25977.1 UDP-3-O-(3-hydroxymyristoyl)glucosamine N-acyltransferase [Opitutales bacterium]
MSIHGVEISFSVEELRVILGGDCRVIGVYEGVISGIASLDAAQPGELSFLANLKYRKQAQESRASVILIPLGVEIEPGADQCFIEMEHPSLGLARVCETIEDRLNPRPAAGIDPMAKVAPDAEVSDSAYVGPFCVIESGGKVGERVQLVSHVFVGRSAEVGADSVLFSNVALQHYCQVGARCRVHANTVIGSDGFGYSTVAGVHHKEPQIGIVVVEDDVEIGANVAIDRARFEVTRIGRGAKVDNLVQIAHNVEIGPGSIVVAQTGVSGSTRVGKYVILAGQSGIAGHITIGDQAVVGAQAGVNRDIGPGEKVRGTPHVSMGEFGRIAVLQKRLPDLFKRVDRLEKAQSTSET